MRSGHARFVDHPLILVFFKTTSIALATVLQELYIKNRKKTENQRELKQNTHATPLSQERRMSLEKMERKKQFLNASLYSNKDTTFINDYQDTGLNNTNYC